MKESMRKGIGIDSLETIVEEQESSKSSKSSKSSEASEASLQVKNKSKQLEEFKKFSHQINEKLSNLSNKTSTENAGENIINKPIEVKTKGAKKQKALKL